MPSITGKIVEPDQENKIMVYAYALVYPDKACVEVLESLPESMDLGIFPVRHYAIWVNAEMAGEFDMQNNG